MKNKWVLITKLPNVLEDHFGLVINEQNNVLEIKCFHSFCKEAESNGYFHGFHFVFNNAVELLPGV